MRHLRTRPTFSVRTSPHASSNRRCCITEGNDSRSGCDNSLTDAGPRLSRSIMARLAGSPSALNRPSSSADCLVISLTNEGLGRVNQYFINSRSIWNAHEGVLIAQLKNLPTRDGCRPSYCPVPKPLRRIGGSMSKETSRLPAEKIAKPGSGDVAAAAQHRNRRWYLQSREFERHQIDVCGSASAENDFMVLGEYSLRGNLAQRSLHRLKKSSYCRSIAEAIAPKRPPSTGDRTALGTSLSCHAAQASFPSAPRTPASLQHCARSHCA